MRLFFQSLLTVVVFTVSAGAVADDLPATTHDGLQLLDGSKVRAAYMKPGADLSEYTRVAILDVYVAFRKNWKRDHNRDAVGPQGMVSDKDMQKIRDAVAEEFKNIFIDELSTKGGHELVDAGADGVLIIRPGIINLDVTAPDLMEPGITRTFVTSAGSMTLYMELYDGATGDIVARVIDPRAIDNGMIRYSNSVSNRAEADRILRRWAKLLNENLAEMKSVSSTQ